MWAVFAYCTNPLREHAKPTPVTTMALDDLRSHTIAKKEIKVDGDFLIFGEKRHHKDTRTAYLQTGTDSDFYTLHEVYFALKNNADQSLGTYIRLAKQNKVRAVKGPDRADLLGYIRGTKTASDVKQPLLSHRLPLLGEPQQLDFQPQLAT